MNKYLTIFESHSQYVEPEVKPNVSYCIQEDEVHYNPWTDPRLIVKYNVANASEPTLLYGYYEGETTAALLFDKVEIDGTEVSIADLDTAEGYYQLSVGEHTVKYTLKDPTSIVNYTFGRCGRLTSVTIGNSVTSIGRYAFCGCRSLDGNSRNAIRAINPSASFKGCEVE